MSEFRAEIINHYGKQRIAVYFESHPVLIERFKKLHGAKWSSSKKVWHLPDKKAYRKQFGLPIYDHNLLSEEKSKQLAHFNNWLTAHRYSENTINTYINVSRVFLQFYNQKSISEIVNDDIIYFNNEYILKKKLSNSYQNQFINGIKLFFKTVEGRRLDVELIQRPRKENLLPNVLSKKEVKAILESPLNLKHRTMLS